MRTIKLIFKGLLLYVTTLITILFIMGADSIMEQGIFISWMLAVIALILLCYVLISKEEFDILTLENKFKNNKSK